MVPVYHSSNIVLTQIYYFSGLEKPIKFLCKQMNFKPENSFYIQYVDLRTDLLYLK